ncbi:MAG: hypothetical protein CMH22_05330 [Methylophaga sp.]|nr:hypothetical protein [Methylophaga sp.]MAX51380.1 hypothetical protein [Methylophaga sp.]|tara:strand:+ start:62657 stop:64825 length:2169 start_codon:yes stop_codon:yes gene_type:complete
MTKIEKPLNLTNTIWAAGGEAVEPSNSKKLQGWVAEIPPFQFENWLQNRNDRALAHIIQMGIPEWDANTEYQANQSYVQDEDGEVYRATETHTGVNPKYDTANVWEQPFSFDALKELATEESTGVVRKAAQQDIDQGTPGSIFADPSQIRQLVENINASWITGGVLSSGTLPDATESDKGAVRKARQSDIDNGTGDDRFISPRQLKSVADDIKSTTAGVALSGNPVITAGSSENYQITNFSSFDTYEVSIEFDNGGTGNVSITDDLISVDIDAGATGGVILTVTKGGVAYDFELAIGSSRINRPSIIFPVNGATNMPTNITLESSNFTTTPAGFDTHTATDWQVATDITFSNVIAESLNDTTNLLQWSVDADLQPNTTYYARVRYYGNTLTVSSWSQTASFETAERPATPTITSPSNGEINVGETPTITTSNFSSPISETHQATDWEIRLASNDSLVWSSMNNTSNLTSITVPSGQLAESTEYRIRVRHIGSQLGASAWGTSTFTTEAQFFVFDPSSAGEPFGGGYYAGANIVVGGTTYALVVAPKAQGGEAGSTLPWEWTVDPDVPGATSTNDGASNTAAIVAAGGSSTSVAAGFCNNLSINGYTDWHLPSADELEICYRYLKPTTQANYVNSSYGPNPGGNGSNPNSDPVGGDYTSSNPAQTSIAIYQSGASEAFVANYYWTSTQLSAGVAWRQRFDNGDQGTYLKSDSYYVRAVRWVEV